MRSPVNEYRFTRKLATILTMVLTAYPVVELTRCILQYNLLPGTYPPGYPEWVFVVELCIIWIGWLVMPVVVWLGFTWAWKTAERMKGGR